MSRVTTVVKLGALLAPLTACAVEDVGTSAYAHESPPAPTMGFVTFLGGSGADEVLDIVGTTGSSPRVFAVGASNSPNFPVTLGPPVGTAPTVGCDACPQDAFAARYDAPGRLRWAIAIGGPGYHRASAAAVALDLDLFVGGSAATLPADALANTADPTFAGGSTPERGAEDGFVCRLDGASGAIEWCTFVGGDGPGGVQGLALDPSGDGVVAVLTTRAGETFDPVYTAALAGGHRATPAGADTLVVRIAGDGSAFTWATFVGGTGDETGTPSIALDGTGVHVLTGTTSTDAPTPRGLSSAAAGVYYANLSLDGTTLRYGTYLGGPGDRTDGRALAPDGDGRVVVGLTTTSAALPTTSGALQSTFAGAGAGGCTTAGDGDLWLAVIDPAQDGAASLDAATYLGRAHGDRLGGLGLDRTTDLITIAGRTHASDFPVESSGGDAVQSFNGPPCTAVAGSADGFIAYLPITLTGLFYSSYLGGSSPDGMTTAGTAGSLRLAGGTTRSSDFRTSNPQHGWGGGASDGVVAAVGFWPLPPPTPGDAFFEDDAFAQPDAGTGVTGDDDGGCCGSAPDPRGALAVAALALLALARPGSRRPRRARVTRRA